MSIIRRLICMLFGHSYYVIEEFSPRIRHIGCRRCGREWGMHDDLMVIVEWDDELAEASHIAYPKTLEEK